MKKIIITTILILTFISSLMAQRIQPVDERINLLKLKLDLTEEQENDIRLILLNERKQAEQQRTLNKEDLRAIRAAAQERRELTDRQIENVLKPEQKEKYKEIRKNEPEYSDRRMIELSNRLKLSDAQSRKIEQILISSDEERMTIRESANDRRMMFENMHKMQAKTDKEIKEVLTKEQKEEYEKYCKERDEKMQNDRGIRRGGRGRMR